jgi:methanogenic corrinoid protein MtbC1
MSHTAEAVHLGGRVLGAQRHVCGFFQNREQEYRTLLPFVQEGFERGEKAIHIVDPALRADHLGRLAAAGIDVVAAERRKQLAVLDWNETYLRERPFNRRAMAAIVEGLVQQAREDGFLRCRMIGHGEWALADTRPAQVDYEARMNETLPAHDDPVVCAYDRSLLDPRTMTDLLRAHPTVIVDGALLDNPCFQPPARFLARQRGRALTLLRDRFLAGLVAGAEEEALGILLDEGLGDDVPVPRAYLEVVQPALNEIGQLWQEKRLTEVQVHAAVDIVRTALARLRPLLPGRAPSEHSAVVACVEGELHDLGGRMVADFFEMAGFTVSFLGANVRTSCLEQLVSERPPRLLALSASTTASLGVLRRAITTVRRAAGRRVVIAVGGRALLDRPILARRFGADLHARDAGAAAAAARRLLEG